MREKSVRLIWILIVINLVACTTNAPKKDHTNDENIKGWVLLFDEKRKHEPESKVRMLVTKDFLRIDDGKDDDDYLLYDRKNDLIYNVVVEDETILTLSEKAQTNKDHKKLVWRVEQEQSRAVMSRAGQAKSEFRRYLVNEKQCRSVVSVADLLPEALQALREYRRALSRELSKGLQYQDSDDICYLAMNVLEPDRHLKHGFPVREWDENGYQRFLEDYKVGILMPKRLFSLPKHYNRYAIE